MAAKTEGEGERDDGAGEGSYSCISSTLTAFAQRMLELLLPINTGSPFNSHANVSRSSSLSYIAS